MSNKLSSKSGQKSIQRLIQDDSLGTQSETDSDDVFEEMCSDFYRRNLCNSEMRINIKNENYGHLNLSKNGINGDEILQDELFIKDEHCDGDDDDVFVEQISDDSDRDSPVSFIRNEDFESFAQRIFYIKNEIDDRFEEKPIQCGHCDKGTKKQSTDNCLRPEMRKQLIREDLKSTVDRAVNKKLESNQKLILNHVQCDDKLDDILIYKNKKNIMNEDFEKFAQLYININKRIEDPQSQDFLRPKTDNSEECVDNKFDLRVIIKREDLTNMFHQKKGIKKQLKLGPLTSSRANSKVSGKFTCTVCGYQTKVKGALTQHMTLHKDPPEIQMFKCEKCSYQCKLKGNLQKHTLVHKDPSEMKMYKCTQCSYQGKQRGSLRKHMLVHQEPSQMKMYKCDECDYKGKRKCNLDIHMLVHSVMSQFRCYQCDFDTKYRMTIQNHLLIHKDPARVEMFKCPKCDYKCKQKNYLHKHMVVHKSPSELNMYNCNKCERKYKRSSDLNKHKLLH